MPIALLSHYCPLSPLLSLHPSCKLILRLQTHQLHSKGSKNSKRQTDREGGERERERKEKKEERERERERETKKGRENGRPNCELGWPRVEEKALWN